MRIISESVDAALNVFPISCLFMIVLKAVIIAGTSSLLGGEVPALVIGDLVESAFVIFGV